MTFRLVRFALLACGAAAAWVGWVPVTSVVHADPTDASTGSCRGDAQAYARQYDGSMSGSAQNSFSAGGYSLSDCNGLGQSNGRFTAGLACQNAGIPPGLHGWGDAIVNWTATWRDDATGEETTIGPIQDYYECGDT